MVSTYGTGARHSITNQVNLKETPCLSRFEKNIKIGKYLFLNINKFNIIFINFYRLFQNFVLGTVIYSVQLYPARIFVSKGNENRI